MRITLEMLVQWYQFLWPADTPERLHLCQPAASQSVVDGLAYVKLDNVTRRESSAGVPPPLFKQSGPTPPQLFITWPDIPTVYCWWKYLLLRSKTSLLACWLEMVSVGTEKKSPVTVRRAPGNDACCCTCVQLVYSVQVYTPYTTCHTTHVICGSSP